MLYLLGRKEPGSFPVSDFTRTAVTEMPRFSFIPEFNLPSFTCGRIQTPTSVQQRGVIKDPSRFLTALHKTQNLRSSQERPQSKFFREARLFYRFNRSSARGTWSEAQRLGSGGPSPNRNRAQQERPALRTPCRGPRPLHQERRLGGWRDGGGDVGEGTQGGVAGGRGTRASAAFHLLPGATTFLLFLNFREARK